MKYLRRFLEKKLNEYLKQFPIVAVTGSRQSGKSTLLQHSFNKSTWQYITLDARGTLERIQRDPDLFIKDIHSNIIIDEAQKAPELFHSIKYLVDQGSPHKIILSGSANFQLLSNITESLAGRAGLLELFPFSCAELFRTGKGSSILNALFKASSLKSFANTTKIVKIPDSRLMDYILFGSYPKIHEFKSPNQKINWLENYRTTYIERDLRDLTQVADINIFQQFYQILAFQTGSLLNLSNVSKELGISVNTCKKYLNILQASYQYFTLPPFHTNQKKRLIKTSKIYISDTGLANFFLGNITQEDMKYSNKFGGIFENFVISEIIKYNSTQPVKSKFYFWRTSNGAEIDLIIEKGLKIIPVEIKSAVKIPKNSIQNLSNFIKDNKTRTIPFGVIFYRGDEIYKMEENIIAVPVSLL